MNSCTYLAPFLSSLCIVLHTAVIFFSSLMIQEATSWQISYCKLHHPIVNVKSPFAFTASTSTNSNRRFLYREFMEDAWEMILNCNSDKKNELALHSSDKYIPEGLKEMSVSGRGGNFVRMEVDALEPSTEEGSGSICPVRLARYGLLETTTSSDMKEIVESGTHVLNLVIFPTAGINLPVFGADLVSLPGNKHLVAIDLQPLEVAENGIDGVLADVPLEIQEELQHIREKYYTTLEWGGEIPDEAKRFFSQYALWTRLSGDGSVTTIRSTVRNAFCDYLQVYLKLAKTIETKNFNESIYSQERKDGQRSYLNYRRSNDPAQPMLKALFGEETAERLIGEVFFKDFTQ